MSSKASQDYIGLESPSIIKRDRQREERKRQESENNYYIEIEKHKQVTWIKSKIKTIL